MNSDDRKRRFNEAIVNMLYPSPESPPQPQREQELKPVEAALIDDGSRFDIISGNLDDYDNASTSGNEEPDSKTTEKLTRAQRKKVRKKKLKEEAIHRGKLIGPLLPLTPTQVQEDAPTVRSNAPEEGYAQLGLGDDNVGACAKSVKVKHRRMAKRLAKEKQNASTSENVNQSSVLEIKEARL